MDNIPEKDQGLINWAKQFLNPNGVFLDIGSKIGPYSIGMSQFCKSVYYYQTTPNPENISDFIKENVSQENIISCFNLNIIEDIASVQLVRFNSDSLRVFSRLILCLHNNKYPPILFSINEEFNLKKILEGFGYQIITINGCSEYLLASNHQSREDIQKSYLLDLKGRFERNEIPSNPEELLLLATHFRNVSNHKNSAICVDKGLNLILGSGNSHLPLGSHFQIENDNFQVFGNYDQLVYKFMYERMIISYYLKEFDVGYGACEYVNMNPRYDFGKMNQAMLFVQWYLKQIETEKIYDLNLEKKKYNTFQYYPSSPSILSYIQDDEDIFNSLTPSNENQNKIKYKCNVRAVNYRIKKDGGYIMNDPENRVRTRNFLNYFDQDFKLINSQELRFDSSIKLDVQLNETRIMGLEDVRLFGANKFISVCCQVNEQCVPQIVYGTYDSAGIIETLKVLYPPGKEGKVETQKNWLPLEIDQKIYLIYSFHPFIVYRMNEDLSLTETWNKVLSEDRSYTFFRGSAPPILFRTDQSSIQTNGENEYICLVHQVLYTTPRKYYHRFVKFRTDGLTWDSFKYSDLFYFKDKNIEYSVSILGTKEGLLIPTSYRDGDACVRLIKWDTIQKLNWTDC